MGNKQPCFVHHQCGPGGTWNLGLDSHWHLCWHVSASLRAAAWGFLIEWLLCCEGADWNQLEINPLYLSLHSSAGHTPDGAAICVSFYLALLAHRQLAPSRKNEGKGGMLRLFFMRRPGRRKILYPSPLDVKIFSRMWNWCNVQKYRPLVDACIISAGALKLIHKTFQESILSNYIWTFYSLRPMPRDGANAGSSASCIERGRTTFNICSGLSGQNLTKPSPYVLCCKHGCPLTVSAS